MTHPVTSRRGMPTLRLVVLLVVIWGLLIIRLGAPWFGVQEAARIWVLAGVRNYDLYGLEATGGMVIRDLGPADTTDFAYYTHHPPTIIWYPYAMSQLSGFNDLSVRYVFVAATMIAVAAFYVFVRRLYGERMAWWATAFYGLVPMMAYYGRVPNHDLLGMAVAMIYAAVIVNWLRQPNRPRLLLLILLAWMAVWSAWTTVFFIAFIGISAMVVGRREHRLTVIGLGGVTILAFITLMLFYQSQWDGAIDSLIEVFGWRASNLSDDVNSQPFTAFEFLWTTLVHIGVFVTLGVTVMSFWGVLYLRRHRSRQAVALVMGLFLSAAFYQLVFRNASFVHDYYKLTFVPVMAISAAAAWVYARQDDRIGRWARPVLDALLVVSILSGGAWLAWLHNTGNRPTTQAIIDVINTETTQDDVLLTHLEGRDLVFPLAYYTFRDIDQAVSYPEALSLAEMSDQRVIYIHCPEVDADFDTDVPPDTHERYRAALCDLYALN